MSDLVDGEWTSAEMLCPHGVPDDDPCEPCEDYARRFSNPFKAPGKIVVLPPASWADGAADLLERALYLPSMTVEDADPVKAAIEEHLAVRAVFARHGATKPSYETGPEHTTETDWCWCQPRIEHRLLDGAVIIHRRTADGPE